MMRRLLARCVRGFVHPALVQSIVGCLAAMCLATVCQQLVLLMGTSLPVVLALLIAVTAGLIAMFGALVAVVVAVPAVVRLTVHVLEAVDPAAAILEFTKLNHVDHIVIGARQNSMLRALLGSVSSRVAAEASCSVTVVRPPRLAAQGAKDETGR